MIRQLRRVVMIAAFIAVAAPVGAQDPAPAQDPEQAPPHDMSKMDMDMDMDMSDSSGWHLMQDGSLYLLFNSQGGPRGGDEFTAPNWWMGMATRRAGRGDLTLTGMFSLDPATVGTGGYREIFQVGEAVDGQVRKMLDTGSANRPFECGGGAGEGPGRAALVKLVGKLEKAAALSVPLDTKVVRRSEANAVALPGGHIYVFEGLLVKSESADEVAGIIAHEIGHVAHRDGMRSLLQSAGLSFMFGMLLGDFVGGTAVVIGARAVLRSSYTREVESAADRYAVDLMNRAGGDQRALAVVLNRIAGAIHPGMEILRDHPDTQARVKLINDLATASAPQPLLEPSEWAALKRICTGR